MISNIRHAMATDTTIVLIGCAPIHGNFYDLFNQRFSPDQRVVNGQLTVSSWRQEIINQLTVFPPS